VGGARRVATRPAGRGAVFAVLLGWSGLVQCAASPGASCARLPCLCRGARRAPLVVPARVLRSALPEHLLTPRSARRSIRWRAAALLRVSYPQLRPLCLAVAAGGGARWCACVPRRPPPPWAPGRGSLARPAARRSPRNGALARSLPTSIIVVVGGDYEPTARFFAGSAASSTCFQEALRTVSCRSARAAAAWPRGSHRGAQGGPASPRASNVRECWVRGWPTPVAISTSRTS
jgi:hypothetical protein